MAEFRWTPEHEATLRKLHAEGYSSSQIALQIGGPSRNAVIGKVHRLGLARPKLRAPEPEARKPLQTARPVNFARKPTKSDDERREAFQAVADKALDKFDATVAASAEPVRFLDRGRFQCSMPQPGWDDAHVREKMVCGQPVQAGTSWCPACLKIVSSPAGLARFKHQSTMRGIAA
ncbi:GcrA family cell cycle regulator [Bosea sp. TAF32]|uniref:GcrA family cell cycle regulator n=1 Tax=Bosea sp. TAF32 TaxID=3237482 RepID=UPI003F8E059B